MSDINGSDISLNIPAQFRKVAASNPSGTAVADCDKTITYGDLDKLTDIISGNLVNSGLNPGDGVAFCLQRSWKAIALILGILKAGGHYIPVDSLSPAGRILSMIALGKPALVVTDGSLLPWPAAKQTDFNSLLSGQPGAAGSPVIKGNTPAYINFTSGSTGTPKAVVIPHAAVISLTCDVSYINLGANHVFLNMSNLAFDAATFEIFIPLLNGGTCAVYGNKVPDFNTFAGFLKEKNVTHAWMTSSLFNWVAETEPASLQGLSELWIGGDVVSGKHVRIVYDACPGLQVVNGYGPTECTTFSLCYKIPRSFDPEKNVPIGFPIDRTLCQVLDEQLQPVPKGAVGELFIGGCRLALGYRDDAFGTKKRFIELPSPAGGASARYFKTGDKVFESDGLYHFVGRTDNQVKLRGYRIELEEIETALRKQPVIREAVVKKQRSAHGEYLAAFITTGAALVSIEDIKSSLRKHVPEYMVPAVIVKIDKFPLNENGKIDRKLLQADPVLYASEEISGLAPASGIESICLDLIRKISGLPITPADRFQDAGVQSLHLASLADKLAGATGVTVSLSMVFRYPDIKSLAAAIQNQKKGSNP